MAVSKHLKVMDEAGLIRREKDGRVHRCSFDPQSLERATSCIEKHRAFLKGQLDSLASYLEAPAHGGRGKPEDPADGGPRPTEDRG